MVLGEEEDYNRVVFTVLGMNQTHLSKLGLAGTQRPQLSELSSAALHRKWNKITVVTFHVSQPWWRTLGSHHCSSAAQRDTADTQPLLSPQSLSTVCGFYLFLFPRSEKDAPGNADACQCEMHPCMGFSCEQDCRLCKHHRWGVFLFQTANSLRLNVNF